MWIAFKGVLEMNQMKQIWCETPVDILKEKSMVIAMEELAELQQAISKGIRGKLDNENLHEEIADVLITLEWMKYYFNADENRIVLWKEYKQNRIINRIKNNELN